MIKKHYNKTMKWIEKHRFKLLLLATVLVLVLPAMAAKGVLGEILFVVSMSFLFAQSMIVASSKRPKWIWVRYSVLGIMMVIFWLEPTGWNTPTLDIIRLLLLVIFFSFVTYFLVRFLRKSPVVNSNVIITAINIYLLMGITFSSLSFFYYKTLKDAYNFPSHITEPNFVNFNYYTFITMSTVGYGDITPRLPQSQTLAFLIAITGQLYVAIIIAFLVGKLLVAAGEKKDHHE
jgi:voltage-gated potassium channel